MSRNGWFELLATLCVVCAALAISMDRWDIAAAQWAAACYARLLIAERKP